MKRLHRLASDLLPLGFQELLRKPKKKWLANPQWGDEFGNGNSNIHMSIHMHTREYAYYTCIISYSVKTEARPIANTRPAGSCNIFPLGIWNFGSDLQDGWQIEKLFGALSFSNLTRVSAFSLTPLPGIQASWILFNRFCNIKS